MEKEDEKKVTHDLSNLPDLETKPHFLFARIVVIMSIMLFINLASFLVQGGVFNEGLTGFSVKDSLSSTFNRTVEMSPIMKIFLISQWALLLLILAYSAFKDKNLLNQKKDEKELHIQKNLSKNKTDLDVLYEVLQKKKKLKISAISKAFKVSKEIAMEWCKILESGNLAEIDYPGFGQPVIKLTEEYEKEKQALEGMLKKVKPEIESEKSLEKEKKDIKNQKPLPKISKKEIKKIKKEIKKPKISKKEIKKIKKAALKKQKSRKKRE